MHDFPQYDPRVKSLIKDAIYWNLYGPVQKKLQEKLEIIIVRNTVILGGDHKSFSYKGKTYSCDISAPPRKIARLVPELHPPMDEYLTELRELNENEMPFVLGFINNVLNSTTYLQDYLKVLPDAVHGPILKLIQNCPCSGKKLTPFDIDSIKKKNQKSIDLIKQRMVTNLLLQN